MPPFVLVDGSYFLFRAFHALPPLTTSTGLHTNAIRGASSAIQKLMRRTQPTHMAVIFDTPEPTFRHKLSPIYKGDRPSMPEELSQQIPYLHALIKALGIPLYSLPGAEADDIIGTLTKRALSEGHHVLISTGDKDMAQLVNPHVKLEDSFKERVLDEAGVLEKFGVHPHQIIDYLTLMGDASDGIMGVPGVGAKTAAKLLTEYGSLDNIIANVDQLKGKISQNIKDNLDNIKIDHQLASIVCDLDLALDWHDLKLSNPNINQLRDLYTELEFRNQLQSLDHPNNPNTPAYQQTSQSIVKSEQKTEQVIAEDHANLSSQDDQLGDATYHTVLTQADWATLLQRMQQADHFAIDTETTNLDYRIAELVGFSVAFDAHDAYYVPVAHDYEGAPEQLNREHVLEQIKPILENEQVKKIGHHLKYDAHIFANHGITIQGWYFDTMLASYVLNAAATRHGMDDVARVYLSHLTTTFEQIAGKGAKQKTFNQIELEVAAHYAAEDAHVTYRLYEVLSAKLKHHPELVNILHNIEMPVARVLTGMEEDGIKLDHAFLDQLSVEFSETMQTLENQATELAGEAFNIASPKQVGEVLFDRLGLKGGKKTATGQYSTSESILEKIEHPLAEVILEHRGLAKLKNTYTDRLVEQSHDSTHRVHTSYHQALTATGRLSSTDPNLQNIPIRTPIGRQIRRAFIAPEGRVLLAADYSQIELRLMAHFSQDDALVHAFQQGQDVHRRTAAEVLGIDIEDVTNDQRRQAKAVNFGLLYGMSEFGLTRQLGFTREESRSYIARYFQRYPGVLDYMERTRQIAREQGFVETILGRRLYTPDILANNKMIKQAAERAAINAPLQGSAADIIKLAMIAVDKILPKDQAKLLLQVHDELVFEADETIADELSKQIAEVMQSVLDISVPFVVEVGQGQNWDAAH
ncbi:MULTISPECIES: DNA polymerase I [Acinetobacter]|uniref:DNA polymerase I n=2 Tax=Acinetobacter haemolyticus TaxID=29430 RepID=A0AAJ2YUF2_ACIHA|nr:DNA polymerase I [Acinetobacter haemolyticus]AZN67237.1 DNA polymerase I [Acinetobacter haemolyticus]ENW21912.1 DNA polymerase I [Acinetobacter haemolyticus CIP 64.3 = MTCC 9819]EPR88945.1 DNA polymerase I [Acinetobacter haemolyticus CIP 64.3 = MTCC 9819]MEB6677524.1 DNA polymerase I [Acinetobacter haemolyticus]NAR18193.1 DNA polymerase I [Acinetobacter haemolyticus]